MAYSVRHTPNDLAKVVCDSVNFRDRSGIRENRANDAAKCLKLLERAKSGQSQDKDRGKHRGKGEGKHNEKSSIEKSPLKNPTSTVRMTMSRGETKVKNFLQRELDLGD